MKTSQIGLRDLWRANEGGVELNPHARANLLIVLQDRGNGLTAYRETSPYSDIVSAGENSPKRSFFRGKF